ncbi:hypothetical protein QQF64_008216 [Cirrhinus molitorella]|uniref:Uncharacterized protein n=1 Tax=Cirrhinus molitorella TaxID=172907 RepID=A0ABR3M5I8_9TELE
MCRDLGPNERHPSPRLTAAQTHTLRHGQTGLTLRRRSGRNRCAKQKRRRTVWRSAGWGSWRARGGSGPPDQPHKCLMGNRYLRPSLCL